MSTKKPRGRKPKAAVTTEPESGKALPPPGSMERALSELTGLLQRGGGKGRRATKDTRFRAQELIYDAWEAPSREDRIRLAEEALGLWRDCADAYNVLAEAKSESITQARFYYEKGVEAGERALGRKAFEEDEGQFWGILETRPYMRARAGLAECLWRLGQEEEALDHYQDMLRLNPNDNQGIRDLLLTRFLKRGEQEKAGRLLELYSEDGSANFLFSRALWLYRHEGESKAANEALREAMKQNAHVAPYLLGKKKVPKKMPEYIGWGDEPEAKVYAADAAEVWMDTAGARGWLLRSSQQRK